MRLVAERITGWPADPCEVELDQNAAGLPALALPWVESGTADPEETETEHFRVERVEFGLHGVGVGRFALRTLVGVPCGRGQVA